VVEEKKDGAARLDESDDRRKEGVVSACLRIRLADEDAGDEEE